ELLVDGVLKAKKACNILLSLGLERVPEGFLFARGMDAPLDTNPRDRLGKAETGGDDTDRADNRGGICIDLIRRAGQPIAARSGDSGAEGKDRHLALGGKAPDARADHAALYRRTAGAVDGKRHRRDATDAKGALQHRRNLRIVKGTPDPPAGHDRTL